MSRPTGRTISLLGGVCVVLALVACAGKTATSRTATSRTATSRTTTSVTLTTGSSSAGAGAGVGTGTAVATQATDVLAVELLARLGAPAANAVFSPYSVQAALAMVSAGAAGQTASQIAGVLDAADLATLQASNASLSSALERATAPPHGAPAINAARLQIANGLFTQSGLALRPPFVATLSGDFGAAPQRVDFRSAPDAARAKINAWVASRTDNRIEHLMPSDAITPQTALVLANAIYVRAHWASPFDSTATSPGPFFPTAGARVTAQFMTRQPLYLLYAQGAGYREVQLPYLDSTLSMLIVMPQPGTLPSFQQSLSPAALGRLDRALATRLVALRLPRFHLVAGESLDDLLALLGMPLAFSDGADFSGITAQTRLKISRVQHAADLTVDESGTVATAATGVAVAPTAVAVPSRPIQLTLDHPFLVFLRDDATGTILFAARVADPTRG